MGIQTEAQTYICTWFDEGLVIGFFFVQYWNLKTRPGQAWKFLRLNLFYNLASAQVYYLVSKIDISIILPHPVEKNHPVLITGFVL